MRELKFRIYNKVKKHWTQYGFDILGEISLMGYVGYDGYEDRSIRLSELNDLVVTQYTGITDRNDKPIYEGDIISIEAMTVDDVLHPKTNYVVKWFAPCYHAESIVGYLYDDLETNPKFYEVIGNIFENPELLKGVDK